MNLLNDKLGRRNCRLHLAVNGNLLILILIFIANSTCINSQKIFQSKFTSDHLSNSPVMLIPFPQKTSWGEKDLDISQLNIKQVEVWPDLLAKELKAIVDYHQIETSLKGSHSITFKKNKSLGNEEYHLTVSKLGIEIEAATDAGHFYALQTLRQLVKKKKNKSYIPLCEIKDWPAYPVRGYMIDVGRNFQSIATLKKQIDVMAMYKMNVFHWHLTDRPAWRIESKAYPELTNPNNHRSTRDPGKFYSYNDIRVLIAYAREKHITIIPEIDMPGHSDSFRKSMGVKMESEKGMKILETVLDEFFTEIPKKDCPIIHIGSDEVRIDNPDIFITRMVNHCKKYNRKVIIWNPGLIGDSTVIRQTWQTKHVEKSNFEEIDSWNNYINNGEPMTQILRLFFKPIGYPSDDKVLGGILCFWPDVNLENENDAFNQNPVFPSILTYAWKTWTDDISAAPSDYYTMLPEKGSNAFNYFSEFEKILLYHKNTFLKDLPFQYFLQCDKEWKLIGPFDGDDGVIVEDDIEESYYYNGNEIHWKSAYGNTLVIKDRFQLGGYFPVAKEGQSVYALTYIFSDKPKTVKSWIGFETPLRANRVYTGIPDKGDWDVSGGKIWINDQLLGAPEWENFGWQPSKSKGWGSREDQEIPWGAEELYWTREPSSIHLNKGLNKILIKIPCSSSYQNWMFTFVPLDMGGLEFSTDKSQKH